MGRKKGSKNRPKVSPLVEEKLEDNVPADAWDAKNLEQRLPDGVEILGGSETRPPGYTIDMDKVPDLERLGRWQ